MLPAPLRIQMLINHPSSISLHLVLGHRSAGAYPSRHGRWGKALIGRQSAAGLMQQD